MGHRVLKTICMHDTILFLKRLQGYIQEKEMATHSCVLAWRIPGMGEPGGLPSMGSHWVGHDWSDLAAAAAAYCAQPPSSRNVSPPFHFCVNWTEESDLLFYLQMSDLLLHFGGRYLSATIICSGCYCTSKNWPIIHRCVFHISVCLQWRFVVCCTVLFVNFSSSVFWGHLNIPCLVKVTKAECNFGGNLCD